MPRLMLIDGKYVYGPHCAPRFQTNPWRIHAVAARASRNKWLTPSELRKILLCYASCCSRNPWATVEAAVGLYALYGVGLMNGQLPIYPDSKMYGAAVEVARSEKRFTRGASRELELLKLVLKEKMS